MIIETANSVSGFSFSSGIAVRNSDDTIGHSVVKVGRSRQCRALTG